MVAASRRLHVEEWEHEVHASEYSDLEPAYFSVVILAQAISCSNVRGFFPVHELFWLCLVQVSTTQFCSFSFFLMARASDGTDVPVSPVPASSSNMGSPDGSLPDLLLMQSIRKLRPDAFSDSGFI